MNTIKLGTRGSKLALWQAEQTKQLLAEIGVQAGIQIIKTRGDQERHLSFDKMEGKGFFTKEIEEALIRGNIDLAVHSMKDLPTQMDDRLAIAGVSNRADPSDWILIRSEAFDDKMTLKLEPNAIIGTSSVRRKSQLMAIRSDLHTKDLRGNVPTRIQKLRSGSFDAIVLAAAGIIRLDLALDEFELVKLHPREFVPAPAQGVLAYQTRADDNLTRSIVQKLHQQNVAELTNVERSVLKLFDGGCHLPLGVYCEKDQMSNYHIWAAYAPNLDAPLRRSTLSFNTTHGLADGIFESLTKAP